MACWLVLVLVSRLRNIGDSNSAATAAAAADTAVDNSSSAWTQQPPRWWSARWSPWRGRGRAATASRAATRGTTPATSCSASASTTSPPPPSTICQKVSFRNLIFSHPQQLTMSTCKGRRTISYFYLRCLQSVQPYVTSCQY